MKKICLKLLKIVKRVILSFCIIYGFNLIASGLNIFIPINFVTIAMVTFLGIPGLLALIGVYFVLN